MIIRAELRRKQSEYEGEACVVDKVIELPAQRFKQFSRALLADYDFIAENKNVIQYDADSRHCILILDADGPDGFLVDPQGYNYARYSAFVPNVRSLLTPDVEIDRSYLSLAEPWRDESRDEMLRMTLRVDGKPDYTLVLPADEIYLDAVKAYLDIDVFADAMIEDGKRDKDAGAADTGGTLRKDQGASEQIWADTERVHHRAHRSCTHRRRRCGGGRIKLHTSSKPSWETTTAILFRRHTMYIYPDNLAAKATLWLWELKDLAIIGIGFLIGIFSLVRTGALLPLALVVAYGFLSIRFDNTSMHICWATAAIRRVKHRRA